jgi:hypothetical protein
MKSVSGRWCVFVTLLTRDADEAWRVTRDADEAWHVTSDGWRVTQVTSEKKEFKNWKYF